MKHLRLGGSRVSHYHMRKYMCLSLLQVFQNLNIQKSDISEIKKEKNEVS